MTVLQVYMVNIRTVKHGRRIKQTESVPIFLEVVQERRSHTLCSPSLLAGHICC